MSSVGVITSKAVSLQVVANDIAQVLKSKKYEAFVSLNRINPWQAKKMFNKAIIFMVFDPLYITPYLLNYLDYTRFGIKTVVYLDTAGRPKPHMVKDWMKNKISYIANSNFSAEMLREVGLNINRVIYHGVRLDEIDSVHDDALKLKEETKSNMGVDVLFGTVCTNHPKKNLRTLAKAIGNATDKLSNVGFIVVSKPEAKPLFSGIKNCVFDDSMGEMPRLDVLTIIGSLDFLIHPSISEGFGLPVLEAQAFGIPVVHGDFAPLTEISHPEASFRVPISHIDFNNFEEGVFYKCHHYEVESLVEQIEKAYETYTSNNEEYRKMRKKAREKAEQFDAYNLYSAFEKYLA